jgi:GT2 family glycosyltransferase
VAICTRNRRASLERALASLLAAPPPLDWQLLVIDSACQDATPAWLAAGLPGLALPSGLCPQVYREDEPGIARARNRALAEARAPILLFLDDDCTVAPGWIEAHLAAFGDPAVVASGGRIQPVLPPGIPQWIQRFYVEEEGGPGGRFDFGDLPCDLPAHPGGNLPFGANMGLRLAAARAAGGFDPRLGWGTAANLPGEETDLMRRLLAAGGRLRFLPAALVRHHLAPGSISASRYLGYYSGVARLHAAHVAAEERGRRQHRLATLRYRAWRLAVAARFAGLLGRRGRALELRRRAVFAKAYVRARRETAQPR